MTQPHTDNFVYGWNSRKRGHAVHILRPEGGSYCQVEANKSTLNSQGETPAPGRRVCSNCKELSREVAPDRHRIPVGGFMCENGGSIHVGLAEYDIGRKVEIARYRKSDTFAQGLSFDPEDSELLLELLHTATKMAAEIEFREASMAMANDNGRRTG